MQRKGYLSISKNREARKLEFEEKKAKLRAMYRDGKFTEEEYNDDLKRLNESYADVTVNDEQAVDWYARMLEITDITASIAKVFTGTDIEAKRTMLSKLGSNLIWNNEELNIHNDIAIEKLIAGIKSIKAVIPKFEPRKYVANKSSNEKTEPKDPVFSMMLLQQEGLISILSDKEYMQNTWRNLCYLKELIKAGEVPEIA